jgi:hypothetical protein
MRLGRRAQDVVSGTLKEDAYLEEYEAADEVVEG